MLGERLFLETRFAQYFAAHSNGEVNQPLAQGDPTLPRSVIRAQVSLTHRLLPASRSTAARATLSMSFRR